MCPSVELKVHKIKKNIYIYTVIKWVIVNSIKHTTVTVNTLIKIVAKRFSFPVDFKINYQHDV